MQPAILPTPTSYEIVEAAQCIGDPPAWLILYQGFQVGGDIDRSGAGDLTFNSYAEASDYLCNLLPRLSLDQ